MDAATPDLDATSDPLGIDGSGRALERPAVGNGSGSGGDTAPAPPSAEAPVPAYRFQVGTIDFRVLDAGTFGLSANFLAFNAPPRALAAAMAEAHLPEGDFPFPAHPVLVETGGQRVLIDAGLGQAMPEPGTLPAALAAEGIAPEEIDVVLLTHLHFDHATGVLDAAGKPIFPKARHLVGRVDYEFWWGEPALAELPIPAELRHVFRATAKGALIALEGKIEQVEPGDEVAPGVRVVDAPGHTPGQLAVEVASGGERLLHVADAAAQPVLNLAHPDWFIGSDTWPAQALLTRRALLDRAAAENLLVLTYHFPFPGLGRVATDGDGWRWMPAA